MKYHELLSENARLGSLLKSKTPYAVGVLSNLVVSPLREIMEYTLRREEIHAQCTIGEYDNILQDAPAFADKDLVIVLWEVAGLTDGFQYRAELMSDEETDELLKQTEASILFLFKQLVKTPVVVFNRFTALPFSSCMLTTTRLESACHRLNRFLTDHQPANVVLADPEKVLVRLSIDSSIDFRNFYHARALYTVDFYRVYAEMIKPVAFAQQGRSPKALIFDGDNTLWEGILGEDPPGEISISSSQPGGAVFEEVHALALASGKQGVILGMNSKNNAGDVEAFLVDHPQSLIRWSSFTIRKINWDDKVSNLKRIAASLNIGLDSILFIDDSDFEINYIREKLPMVRTLQVPRQRSQYPQAFREALNLFFQLRQTEEDQSRLQMYREQEHREEERLRHNTLEDYLRSLSLCITLPSDITSLVPRIAQLTQKTNQFNLTTCRYTEPEIHAFIANPDMQVIPIHVSDRFGDSGITGLAIIRKEGSETLIDTLLMSCRIIGRNLELSFADLIMQKLKEKGVKKAIGYYKPTTKNGQVAGFYEKLGFSLIEENEQEKRYDIMTERYKPFNLPYIKLHHG